VADANDCMDTDALVHPLTPWFVDADGDGHGAGVAAIQCVRPADGVLSSDDCDDDLAVTYPGAVEQCDVIDNNCDGVVDEGVVNVAWYVDGDGDGYGDATAPFVEDCAQPADGYVALDGDCDDGAEEVHPGADEMCDDVDHDCDGQAVVGAVNPVRWFRDADADGFGVVVNFADDCVQPSGFVLDLEDCDDDNLLVYPGGNEVCDGSDNDCNGDVDDVVDAPMWLADRDEDGHGDPSDAIRSCQSPDGYVSVDAGADCDDGNADVHPGAQDKPLDGFDADCLGDADVLITETWSGAGGACANAGQAPVSWLLLLFGMVAIRKRRTEV